jgi:hypothetical protein
LHFTSFAARAHGIFDQLNWKMELSGRKERFHLEDAKWGGLPDGHVVGKPVPLFPVLNGRAMLCGAADSPWLDGVSPYHFTTVEQ